METEKVWRVHQGIWLLIGPLVIFSFGFSALYLLSPLWNLFNSNKASPLLLAFFVLVGAPLFLWMTVGLLRATQCCVRADEKGLHIVSNDRKGLGLRLIEDRVRWDEIRALYTQTGTPDALLRVWTGQREILLPLRFPDLRAELEHRTGLQFEVRRYPPVTQDFGVEWSGAALFQKQRQSSIVGWAIWLAFSILLVALVWKFVWPNFSPEMLPPLGATALAMGVGTLRGAWGTVFELRRLHGLRDEVWRFDFSGIRREKAGETTFLPLASLERLEKMPQRRWRATGSGTTLEWPQLGEQASREVEFLRDTLAARPTDSTTP